MLKLIGFTAVVYFGWVMGIVQYCLTTTGQLLIKIAGL